MRVLGFVVCTLDEGFRMVAVAPAEGDQEVSHGTVLQRDFSDRVQGSSRTLGLELADIASRLSQEKRHI